MRVGIVGGGQLGRMLALAAHRLGITVTTLDPSERSSAAQVAPAIVGSYDDRRALEKLADVSDIVTYEFENVPVEAARFLAERVPVFPPPEALETAQDRLNEKMLFTEVGLPVPAFAPIEDIKSLRDAIDGIGLPAMLKSRRLGYDGKGQVVIRHGELAEDAWRAVGEVSSLLEALVPFGRELSIVGARGRDGATGFYPLVENVHREGILRHTEAPARGLTEKLQATAEDHAAAVMLRLDHVGVLAIELFDLDGELLGNEIAPRVHNSAHWTIEGAETDQFEQHLRAVAGLPLGAPSPVGHSGMVNLIGGWPEPTELLAVTGAHLHLYGKEPRPGRKVGHITIRANDQRSRDRGIERVLQLVGERADT
jgi:5-(carboxyamino)imidazole ribonucleotide synthase